MLEALVIFILAFMPISEVRGAIPYGLLMGLDPIIVLSISILGNISPIPLLLLLLSRFEALLLTLLKVEENPRFFSKIVKLYFSYVNGARDRARPFINRYGALGLAIFTAIPLPFTGAWTSSLAAHVLGMDRIVAFVSISLGVVSAALIVMLLVKLGMILP